MDDILDPIKKILSDIKPAKLSLEEAVLSEKLAKDTKVFVKKALAKAKTTQSEKASEESLKEVKKQASLIYIREVTKAANQSEEYNYPAFLSPLIDVGNDDSLYKITLSGNGWNRSISIELAMDEVAGTINDYAEAVESARGALNVKEDRDPTLASKFWRDRVYRGPRYFTTINLRLAASSKPAPFWSLLNYGSASTSMSSDIGGTPYPSRGAHRFVEHTEIAIKQFFRATMLGFKEKFDADVKEVNTALEEVDTLLKELQTRIDKLSQNSELMARIAGELGVTVDRLNASKIFTAKARIMNGELLTERVVVSSGIRVRAKKFIELISGE